MRRILLLLLSLVLFTVPANAFGPYTTCKGGGVQANQFLSALTSNCTATLSQPAFSNLSGSATTGQLPTLNFLATFSTGVLAALPATSSEYNCFKARSTGTVINGEVAFDGATLTCATGPTIALQDCGASSTCAGPTTRLSVQISSGSVNTITDMTIQNSGTITVGNYYCWEVSAGTCAVVTGGFSGSAALSN